MLSKRHRHGLLFVWGLCLIACGKQLPEQVEEAYGALPATIDYNFHVKPILSDRCYKCHGPDEQARKAGLRLDLEETAFAHLESGHRAFVKGQPGRSAVYQRVINPDPEMVMPPPESGLALSAREIAILTKWIEQGAIWKPHWSLIPISRPDLPAREAGAPPCEAIDCFILEKLAELGLAPNSRADREHLLRRVTMDLTGLPATLEEIDAFLADTSSGAYARAVDRLLASDACAERLTMEWLDIARYADSHGVSFDGARNSWPYKDWVINAFRQNMPFDTFMIEQVAGDLLDNPTQDQLIATSFYRMNQLESSMGSIAEEFRMEYVAERTAVTGMAFLGLTMECARCHDHKFDPISQKEYYQLSAFFNTTPEPGLNPIDGDWAPTILLYSDQERRSVDSLSDRIREQRSVVRETRQRVSNRDLVQSPVPFRIAPPVATFPCEEITMKREKKKKAKDDKEKKDKYEDIYVLDGNRQAKATKGVTLTDGRYGKAVFLDDEYDYLSLEGVGLFERNTPFSVSTWIRSDKQGKGPTQTILGNSNAYPAHYRGWDLYLDSTNHIRGRLIHRLPDDFIEIATTDTIQAGFWTQVGFTYDGSGEARGLRVFVDGSEVEMTVLGDCLQRTIHPIRQYKLTQDSLPVRVGRSYRLWTYDVGLFKGAIDEIQIWDRQLSGVEMAMLGGCDLVSYPVDMVMEYHMLRDTMLGNALARLHTLESQRRAILDTVQEMMVMQEMEHPRKTYILERGVYNKRGEEVDPGTPAHVLQMPEDYPRNRLGLARWLAHPQNPLTARVIINRYWQLIFGQGIVRTVEDFGNQGAVPTHPELLDWLAAEFIDSGWDVRHMLRLMVMSEAYQRSSQMTEALLEQDPLNQYYARGASYRWPAEFIRDNALAASGLLVSKIGGPPVKPYQPEGFWEDLGETSYALAKYTKDTLDNLYRRSMYTFQRRFAPPPFMVTFDASKRELCQPRRAHTNSPLQALVLLNDPQIIEAARVLSERMLLSADTLDEQIVFGFRCSSGVRPSPEQVEMLADLYRNSLKTFQADPVEADSMLMIGDKPGNPELDKAETAAMTIVASTIFNSDAFYMKR